MDAKTLEQLFQQIALNHLSIDTLRNPPQRSPRFPRGERVGHQERAAGRVRCRQASGLH